MSSPYRSLYEQQQFDRSLLNAYLEMYNSTEREITLLQERNELIFERIAELDINHRNLNLNLNGTRATSRPLNANRRSYAFQQPRQETSRNSLISTILQSPLLTSTIRNFYDPIVVRPTEAQIENAINRTTFGSIENPINTECPISLERFEEGSNVTQIAHCGHIFTPSELTLWFNNNVRCPVCRYDIRNYNASSARENPVTETNTTDTSGNTNINQPTDIQRNVLSNFDNDTISNIQQNENGEITFDISSNYFMNFATRALTDLVRNEPSSSSLNNLIDPSGNSILLFETIFRR
jgi:Ring finger domain